MSAAPLIVAGSTGDLVLKAQGFKEIASLVESGFFPSGVTNVKQAMMLCWIADALNLHPLVAIQNVSIIKQRPYFSWRLKWGLVKSRYPEAEMETVKQDDAICTIRCRLTAKGTWQSFSFTREQCRANPVTRKNELYEQDWPDMSYKACVHRALDRLAPEVMLGLPSGELEAVDDVPTNTEPAQRSAAEVLESAAGAGAVESGAATGGNPPDRQGAPAATTAPPAEPKVYDPIAACFAKIDKVWLLHPKTAGPRRREVCEEVLSKLRGEKVKLTTTMAPSDAADILAFLNEKYPDGGTPAASAVVAGETVVGDTLAGAPGHESPTGADEPATIDGGGEGPAGTDAPAATSEPEEVEADVALEPDMDPDVQAAAEAAERERFERDGEVATILDIARAAAKTHPGVPMLKESPAKSGKWYLVNMKAMQARGRTSGRLIYTVSESGATEQKIDADECRALVGLLREQGMMGTVTR